MKQVKIKLSQVPSVYHNQLFANLVKFRGVEDSKKAIILDVTLSAAFPWLLTDEGHEFWEAISEGKSPSSTVTTSTSSTELDEVVKEAEARGFAIGVQTKYGVIKERGEDGEVFDHELTSDGLFYYRNIKVRRADGKWIKANQKPKKGYDIDGGQELPAAIHELISGIISRMGKN